MSQKIPVGILGATGVWFLKNGHLLFPSISGNEQISYSIPAPASTAKPAGTLNQQLLSYLAAWYMSLPDPGPNADFLLNNALRSDPDDALAFRAGE